MYQEPCYALDYSQPEHLIKNFLSKSYKTILWSSVLLKPLSSLWIRIRYPSNNRKMTKQATAVGFRPTTLLISESSVSLTHPWNGAEHRGANGNSSSQILDKCEVMRQRIGQVVVCSASIPEVSAKINSRAGRVAQNSNSACLPSKRLWVETPVLPKKKKK
jgi:hypothetical protein